MTLGGELKTFVAFNAVGLVTTVVGVPVMALLDSAGMPYAGYTALNYGVGIVLGFWLNWRFAFRHRQAPVGSALYRYLVCFATLLVVVQTLQFGLIDGAKWPRWAGVAIGMLFYGGVGYFVSRFWVFNRATMAPGRTP